MTDTKRVLVRMPPELHAAIKARAAEKHISMNDWIVRALASTYRRTTQEPIVLVTEVTL
jgi:predicted HicB family RNase H-like nuclease